MQKEKKGLLALLKEKFFPKKKIQVNNLETCSAAKNPEKTISSASSISEAVRLSEMNKKVDELIKESEYSPLEIYEEALKEARNFCSYSDLDLNKTEKKLSIISFNSKNLKSIAVEVKKHMIVTDFDKLNSLIKENKKISLNEAAKKLKLTQKRIAECANILEKANLIDIHYPPIGAPILSIKGFSEAQKLKNKKK